MTRKNFLEEAAICVCNDRDKQYGTPENSFAAIAALWSWYTKTKIRPEDVGVMMALFKIARIQTGVFKADSYVDAIGYLACAGEIASAESEKPGA